MKLARFFPKNQKYLLAIALILTSAGISIRSKDGKVHLLLKDYPLLIFFLIMVSLLLVTLYFTQTRRKMSSLSRQIREQLLRKEEGFEYHLQELTDRQREVYSLIVDGKSNKEIMEELFIEQSTLKTHINQIYKKLNIKSRRALKYKLKF